MTGRPLATELRELAPDVRWAPTPDLAERVVARIEAAEAADRGRPPRRLPGLVPGRAPAEPAARGLRPRRLPGLLPGRAPAEPAARGLRPRRLPALVPGRAPARALAALVALLVAGALVEPVRSTVLDVLGIAGRDRVIRVPGPPDTSRPALDRGVPATLAHAQQRLAFTIRLPRALGAPREVRFSDAIGGGAVTLVYPDAALMQFEGGLAPALQKRIGPAAGSRAVTVAGEPGLFVTGTRELDVLDRDGHPLQARRSLARSDVLVWQRAGVAYRLEVRGGLRRALAIARSVG